jgi:hypothetical protein
MKANMIDTPDVNVTPMGPGQSRIPTPGQPFLPGAGEPPLSAMVPQSPQGRIDDVFSMLPPQQQPQQPRFNPAQSALPDPASAPQARFNPAQSAVPEQGTEMPWWKRNAYMQTDPNTGAFLDPSLAAQAQASTSGPDLIQKFMKYFHSKTT